jgi:hypothetical protein
MAPFTPKASFSRQPESAEPMPTIRWPNKHTWQKKKVIYLLRSPFLIEMLYRRL